MDKNTEFINSQQDVLETAETVENIPDFKSEIESLKKEALYSDIDDVSAEISDFALEKGITAKEAYNALFGEARAKRLLDEVQKIKDDFHRKSRKIPALSSGSAYHPANDDMTNSEKLAAKLAGISVSEYLKYKNK